MVNSSGTPPHYQARKRIHIHHETFPHPNRTKRAVDMLIYVIVVMGPIMNLPQLVQIWVEKDASGVSLVSWTSFLICSLIWFVYGVLHGDKPIIFMNFALFIIQGLIVGSVVLYS